jgi:hypothetical protein
LIRHGKATADDVMEVIAGLRVGDRGAGHRISPETAKQRAFVQAWAEVESEVS